VCDAFPNGEADLGITKDGPAMATAGDIIRYDIRVDNSGPQIARNVVVIDFIPTEIVPLRLVSLSPVCVEEPTRGRVVCALGDITVDSFFDVFIEIQLPLGQQGNLFNTAIAITESFDRTPNRDFVTTGVVVIDVTPPEITASLVQLCGEDDEGLFRVEFSATDNTELGSITATLNGNPVVDGQIVKLELDDDEEESEFEDGILEIESNSFSLDVTASDSEGNTATVSVVPSFNDLEECDDDDDEEEDEDDDEDEDD